MRITLILSSLLMMGVLLQGCSKATSKAEYKFKKPGGDGVAAKTGDVTVTEEELLSGIEVELYEAEMKIFEIKFNRLKTLLVEKYMAKDPKAKGLTNDEFFEKVIAPTVKVSEQEVNDFIKERKIPAQQINDQVLAKIKQFLSGQKKADALEEWLAGKAGKDGVTVFFQKPSRPTFDVQVGNAPTVGGENAKVTIVEFSDFQCPYCAEGSKVLKQLKDKYGSKIKVAMKQFPLPFHTQARGASIAALCVNEQDTAKFWKMHDELFADQSKLSAEDLKSTAKSLGVDMDKYETCVSQKTYEKQVNADIEQGKNLGVKSTPTFFVNGQLVRGVMPVEEFSELIDQQLAL
ncbi:MAG: hypothetical protein CME65_03395 [Halobacteriovoraceae bacterium]|nr:hypothetical protein [Halobacteriovoraceae bacterium]